MLVCSVYGKGGNRAAKTYLRKLSTSGNSVLLRPKSVPSLRSSSRRGWMYSEYLQRL